MKIWAKIRDESGDLFFQKMILIAISFVVGAVILSMLFSIFDSSFTDRLSEIIESILTW
jgi:hypothetical protein